MWGERCLLVVFFPTALAQGFIESPFMPCTYSCTKLSCKSDVFYTDLLPTWEYYLISKWCFHSLVWPPCSSKTSLLQYSFCFSQNLLGKSHRTKNHDILQDKEPWYMSSKVPVLQATWDILPLRDFLVKTHRLCLVCKCQEWPQVPQGTSVLHTR